MRFTADHAFHIGSQHLRGGMPCQDYALSGADEHQTFAILSDGCSTGGRTDVGARVIVHTTAKAIHKSTDITNRRAFWIGWECESYDLEAKLALNLRDEDLFATCAYIIVRSDGGLALAHILGDGVIAAINAAGHLSMFRYDWDSNMPVYRAYKSDNYRRFRAAHSEQPFAASRVYHGRPALSLPWPTKRRLDDQTRRMSMEEGLCGFSMDYETDNFHLIAVFSDGVTQVDGMDWRDVVAELMNFKSTEGAFVKRRMNRFLKDCLAHGKGPVDDISMACIHIEHGAP